MPSIITKAPETSQGPTPEPKYPHLIAAGELSQMAPLNPNISREGGYEVLCNYDAFDIPKDYTPFVPTIAHFPGNFLI